MVLKGLKGFLVYL